jgi:hypothetical protein
MIQESKSYNWQHILVWFEIMIISQNKMKSLTKKLDFEKFIHIQEWLTQKKDILGQIYELLIASYKKIE